MEWGLSGAGASGGLRLRAACALAVVAGSISLLAFAAPTAAQSPAPGSLDPSFGDISPNQEIRDVLVQPDGKILVSGLFTQVAGQPRGRVARLNPDGTIDPTFSDPQVAGGSGLVETMALQPDGKSRVRCRASKAVGAATTSTLRCRLGSKARKSLRKRSLKLTLTTTFTPTGGTAVTNTRKLTIKRKR